MPSELSISIIALTPKHGGEEAELTVRCENGEQSEDKKLTVAAKQLFEIGNIGPDVIPYALTVEEADRLEEAAKLWSAVKKGLDLLSYADGTKARLAGKLVQRGFDRETAEKAVIQLEALGYLNENELLTRTVNDLSAHKHYGPTRIKSELCQKGFRRDFLDERLPELLGEIDFEESLLRILEKKADVGQLSERKYKERLLASCYRLGYAPSETLKVIKLLIKGNQ